MKEKIPAFVFKHNASEKDWVLEHDTLHSELSTPCSEENQEDWWLKNHKIRQAFNDIEKKVKSEVEAGSSPGIRIVSWMQLSKRVNCDRATPKHPKRVHWTAKRKKEIEALIKNSKENVEHKEEETKDIIKALQDRLDKQRSQTVHWLEKYREKEACANELKALLDKKMHEIEDLNRIIKVLTNKSDTESKVIKLQ